VHFVFKSFLSLRNQKEVSIPCVGFSLQADQLQFPLDRPIVKLHTTDQQAKKIKV
jgi:hypothetical protein